MNMRLLGTLTILIAGMSAAPVLAMGVYKWTDEDGVVHYSQNAPESDEHAVELVNVKADTDNGLGISEEDDPEGYAAHRQEMDQLWADLEEKREKARERQERQARSEVVYVQSEPQYSYSYPFYGYRPPYNRPGKPPVRPKPQPAPVQPPTSTLDPSIFRRR